MACAGTSNDVHQRVEHMKPLQLCIDTLLTSCNMVLAYTFSRGIFNVSAMGLMIARKPPETKYTAVCRFCSSCTSSAMPAWDKQHFHFGGSLVWQYGVTGVTKISQQHNEQVYLDITFANARRMSS